MFVTRVGTKFRASSSSRRHKPVWDPDNFAAPFVDINSLVADLVRQPFGSHSSYNYKREYLSQCVLSKYVDASTTAPTVRQRNAVDKMLRSEATCRRINSEGYEDHILPSWFSSVMHYAQRFIASVLGTFDYSVFASARFSGGASTSRRRSSGDPYYKYAGYKRGSVRARPLDVTLDCYPYGCALIKATPLWDKSVNGQMPNITTGNRITTVPKSSDIDRCIAMEPDVNMALQLAIGLHIRRRLKLIGIDLNDQSTNQRLARVGSIDDSLATIDLSSASDSISHRLVMDLLPYEWYNILDVLRSKRGVLPDGTSIIWEKFSSMGNGYTFELETLLFAALLDGVCRVNDSAPNWGVDSIVYGDDIICQSKFAHNLISVLRCVGFSTNTDKTFTSGPFRESCGKHYFLGSDVSPFYLRGPVCDLYDLCRLCNRIRSWAKDGDNDILDSSVYPIWKSLMKRVPRRLYGGCDLNRTDYVVSTHKSHDHLVTVYNKRTINGFPAILRWMQSANDIANCTVDYRYHSCSDTDNTMLVLHTVERITYKGNDELWLPVCRFSEEIP